MTDSKTSNIIKLFDGYLEFDTEKTANQLYYDLNLRGFKLESMFNSSFCILIKPNCEYDYVITFDGTSPESKPIMIQKTKKEYNWMMGKEVFELIWSKLP